jgi:ribonucleoside-diphosphate reductase alpha chain
MMATLRCDHPDIEEFIAAKQQSDQLRHLNVSVLVTDAFTTAVRADADWPLLFPAAALKGSGTHAVAHLVRPESTSAVPRHALGSRP